MAKFIYPLLDDRYQYRTHNIFKKIITDNLTPKSTILDVGCGSGAIGYLLGKSYTIIGIEKYQEYFKSAQNNCQKLYQLDLNKPQDLAKITEKNIDMIIFGDVLEHLLDPNLVIDQLLTKISSQGLVIISLPNIAQLPYRLKHLMGEFEYSDSGIMDRTHLHLYTLKTAKQLISHHHLKIVRLYPAGTAYSFFPHLPTLVASQFVFLCQKR